MTIRFRLSTPDDRDALVALDAVARSNPQRVECLDRVAGAEGCVVAERDGQVVAYGVLEYSFFDNGFIAQIHVTPDARRQGVGSALVAELVDRCTTPKVFTSTNRSNLPMQRLLDRDGFARCGIVHDLDPGDPELFYVLDRTPGAGSALADSAGIVGTWRIVETEAWGADALNLCGPAEISFRENGSGKLRMIAIQAELDHRVNGREIGLCEFTLAGRDDGTPTSGRGWARVEGDELRGMLFLHRGDESSFRATRYGAR